MTQLAPPDAPSFEPKAPQLAQEETTEQGQDKTLQKPPEEAPPTDSLSFQAADEALAKIRRRFSNFPDGTTRDALTEWLDSEGESMQEDDSQRLAEILPATALYSPGYIGSTITFFLVRDMLRERGHDVSGIKIRQIREGIAIHLYKVDNEPTSPDLELATLASPQFWSNQDSERRVMMTSVTSFFQSDNTAEGGATNQGGDHVKREQVHAIKDSVNPQGTQPQAQDGPPDDDGDDDDDDETDLNHRRDFSKFPESSHRANFGRGNIPGRDVEQARDTGAFSREVQAI
jgi:hypothetical protein